MPKKERQWEIIKDNGEEYLVILEGDNPRKVTDIDEIYNIVTTCPKCGAKATSVSLHKRNYSGRFVQGKTYEFYYLAHYFNNDKHMWYLGPADFEVCKTIAERVAQNKPPRNTGASISEDEKQLLYKVFIRKKGFSREESELARQIFLRLIGLQK